MLLTEKSSIRITVRVELYVYPFRQVSERSACSADGFQEAEGDRNCCLMKGNWIPLLSYGQRSYIDPNSVAAVKPRAKPEQC